MPGLLVFRSLTKTWALAGLRAGYALGAPDAAGPARGARGRRGRSRRSRWRRSIACCDARGRGGGRGARPASWSGAPGRAGGRARGGARGDGAGAAGAPFLLLRLPDGRGERVRHALRAAGIAVRRGDTFPGLGPDHLRVAVRRGRRGRPARRGAHRGARRSGGGVTHGRRRDRRARSRLPARARRRLGRGRAGLRRPRRARVDVGARGRRPGARRPSTRRSTAARSCCVAHHPLLLRGVHGVGADTPKGALVHRLVRGGRRAVHRAHQRRRRRPRRLRRAGRGARARRRGPARARAVPAARQDRHVRRRSGRRSRAVHAALAAAGAGDDRRLLALLVRDGGHRPVQAARRRAPDDRRGRAAGTGRRDPARDGAARAAAGPRVVAALRAAHPYEEPAFDVLELRRPAVVARASAGSATLPEPEPLARLHRRGSRPALPATAWGVRAAGDPGPDGQPGRGVRRGGGLRARRGARRGRRRLRHRRPAPPPGGGAPAAAAAAPALVDVAHWASEWPWCAQAAGVLRAALGGSVEVRVSTRRTDPWTHREHHMKADPAVQRRLLDLAEVDGELDPARPPPSHAPRARRSWPTPRAPSARPRTSS